MRQQSDETKVEKSFIILAATLGALIVLVGLVLGGLSSSNVATADGADSGFAISTR